MTEIERAAVERLIKLAKGDTGGGRRAANFLLAWWNASEQGGFDLTDLFGLDESYSMDVLTVMGMLTRVSVYPDDLGYAEDFKTIIEVWRG